MRKSGLQGWRARSTITCFLPAKVPKHFAGWSSLTLCLAMLCHITHPEKVCFMAFKENKTKQRNSDFRVQESQSEGHGFSSLLHTPSFPCFIRTLSFKVSGSLHFIEELQRQLGFTTARTVLDENIPKNVSRYFGQKRC